MTARGWFRWIGSLSDAELEDLRWEQYGIAEVATRGSREHKWAETVVRLLDLIRDQPELTWTNMLEMTNEPRGSDE